MAQGQAPSLTLSILALCSCHFTEYQRYANTKESKKRHRSHAAQNPYPHQAMVPPLVLGILMLHEFIKCGDVHGHLC